MHGRLRLDQPLEMRSLRRVDGRRGWRKSVKDKMKPAYQGHFVYEILVVMIATPIGMQIGYLKVTSFS